jgi:RimJ/RimL family protein N-acetyltransferase
MNIAPVTLAGETVRLEPLEHAHAPDLLAAARYDEIWRYLDEPTPQTLADIAKFIDDAARDREAGVRLPFAIVNRAGRAVGSTSYIDIRRHDRGLEIGWTWLTPAEWGTGTNTETKRLLLAHAFETLGAIRVALKTDARNLRSQRAIEKLGAVREGVWRNHRILSDGHIRDSVFYSFVPEDWRAAQLLT